MNRMLAVIIILTLALFTNSATGNQSHTFYGPPLLEPGETWQEERISPEKKEVLITFRVKARWEVTGLPRYIIETDDGTKKWQEFWDHDLNCVKAVGICSPRYEKHVPLLQWPLNLGKRWSEEISTAMYGVMTIESEVEKEEVIAARQGKFRALKVRSIITKEACKPFVIDFIAGLDNLLEKMKRTKCHACKAEIETWHYWYAPEAKAIIKSVVSATRTEPLPGCPIR